MISSIDRWIIDKPYQGLVNLLQRHPAWFVEQCAYVYFTTAVLQQMLRPEALTTGNYIQMFVDLLLTALFIASSRIPVVLASVGEDKTIRILILLLTVVFAPSRFNLEPGLAAINLLNDLIFLSVYYFAACKPPPPPEPRTKLVLTT